VTERLYRDDAYLLEFEAQVVARHEHEGRPAVVLDRTAFYPVGGGQPWDTGAIGPARVVAVIDAAPGPLHVVEGEVPAGRVRCCVDAGRREDHRQQHHGQHLLSRAFVEVARARTIAFHLGTDEVTIDLDRAVDDDAVARAEDLANEVVARALPVATRSLSAAEAAAQGFKLPEDAGDDVRVVGAAGFDEQPCGGTHPRNTAEVGVIRVLGTERYKGGTRVRFACGRRALLRWRAQGRALAELARTLSAPELETPAAVQRTQDRLRELERALADARGALLGHEARALAAEAVATAGGRKVLCRRFDGREAGELRELALQVAAAGAVALLGGAHDGRAHLVFAQPAGAGLDVPGLLKAALPHVGGRGGGRGDVAQGGGDAVAGLDAALASAADAAGRAGA
jgi:alanyl-tRNA synthetase